MDHLTVRKAAEQDRGAVAMCIAEGFAEDFSILCRDSAKVAAAIAGGLQMDLFYVAELDGSIAGVLAISDCHCRAARVDPAAMKKHWGFFKGWLGSLVLRGEFEGKLEYPETTGYIEFVAVRQDFRRRGIASALLRESMELADYREFVLDVTDVNTAAIRCYSSLGFEEFRRVSEKHAKQKGFGAKIYMRYARAESECES